MNVDHKQTRAFGRLTVGKLSIESNTPIAPLAPLLRIYEHSGGGSFVIKLIVLTSNLLLCH